ncbi:phage head closure protein [Effusibacillus dendaii]|uniref:Head-tail adaptor protein n=1 Tax=Effusibacillus dendaii TaxID=2743772 RepID=A0A7I8D8P5_9BACL|nr:phage head closure protein [Effusibacillus dendaii]BCJ86455.1 head-tail adaptor protein [Effusibacillus dendaii]
MKIGLLRNRVTIQKLTQTDDGMGGYTEGWGVVATVYASVHPLKGRELFDAQQVREHMTHRVTIRYRVDVTPDMRVLFGAKVFNIRSVINVESKNRELQLLCEEV